jgi:hypothetical protein
MSVAVLRRLARHHLALGVMAIVTTSQAARAEWRYCLAPEESAHKVFLSDPFPVEAETGAIETIFERRLIQAGVPHDRVSCPRADTAQQIAAMRNHAIEFNREFLDRTAVELHWAPLPTLEARRPENLQGGKGTTD